MSSQTVYKVTINRQKCGSETKYFRSDSISLFRIVVEKRFREKPTEAIASSAGVVASELAIVEVERVVVSLLL